MRRTVKHGVEWIYRPGFVYTARYCGWNINIRKVPGKCWRLFVTANGGGNIAFHHQFYLSIDEAQSAGIRMVDNHPTMKAKV